jgi:hypothetical protein
MVKIRGAKRWSISLSISILIVIAGLQLLGIQSYSRTPPPPQLPISPILGEIDRSTGEISWFNKSSSYWESSAQQRGDERWWAGSTPPIWGSVGGKTIQTTIRTPYTGNSGSDWQYYALLSCIDSSLSYDQLGFGAWEDRFYIIYSYTDVNWFGGYIYHTSMGWELQKGVTYTFEMELDQATYDLTFRVYRWGSVWWEEEVSDKGIYFYLQQVVIVGIFPRLSFSLYEEGLNPDAPDSDLTFRSTRYTQVSDGKKYYWDNWIEFYQNGGYAVPSGVDVTINTVTHYVYIDNP